MATVRWLSIAPVKGLALVQLDEVEMTADGVAGNRRFWLVDADGRMYAQLREPRLARVAARWDEESRRLELHLPDGEAVAGSVALGEPVATEFAGRRVAGRLVLGPWAEALSAYVGRPLALVHGDRPGAAVDRSRGQVTLVSEASLAELARRSGRKAVDGRRFRMLIGVDGARPHEEDEWCGRPVRVGQAVVRVLEQVARCAVTTRNPDTGERDFDTLRAIAAYRGLRDGEAIDFGVYGDVLEAGRVRVGDRVEPLA
ncbi:MAG: MOSC domain-containing protein [Thermoleophilia bacterium]|nr:MOSC domain-containing protein [Thermoleophilia bacterium]